MRGSVEMSELLGFVLVLCGALMTSWLMIVGIFQGIEILEQTRV